MKRKHLTVGQRLRNAVKPEIKFFERNCFVTRTRTEFVCIRMALKAPPGAKEEDCVYADFSLQESLIRQMVTNDQNAFVWFPSGKTPVILKKGKA